MSGGPGATAEQVATWQLVRAPYGRCRVGVDGVDGAGKTTFGRALATALRARGRTATTVSADGFLHPRATRYARGRHRTASLDLAADRRVRPEPVQAADDEVLVLDGLFLQRPVVREHLDVVVLLDVPFSTTYERMAARDGCDPDPDHAANRRYRRGQQLYLDEHRPVDLADLVVTEDGVVRAGQDRLA